MISVNSFDEARNYPVMFNTAEIFLDNNRNVFYLKSVDSMGKYTINTYKFEQVENEKPMTTADFATREQFESLSSKLDTLLSQLGVNTDGK
nr:MAG TPA: hypothetical protein [Caudoviricetes sp.]